VDDLNQLIAEITTDAHGDDEHLRAFLQAIKDGIAVQKVVAGILR